MTAQPPAVAGLTGDLWDPALWGLIRTMSVDIAQSTLIPPSLRGRVEDIRLGLLMARVMNENPIFVLQSIQLISGRASWSAQFLIARANGSGRFRGPIRWRVEGAGEDLAVTAYAAVLETGDEVAFTVSMATARAEGWAQRNPKYKSMPETMLRYRSATMLVRMYCPDVLMGLHEADEVVDAGLDTPAQRQVSALPPEPVADPSPPSSPPEPVSGGVPADAAASGGDQAEPARATPQQGRAWRERLAAWREAAELPPLDPEVVADLCEALGNGRPSALPIEKQEQLLGWLDYPEGKGMARYAQIAAERADALACARALSKAERAAAAERAGTATAPGELSLLELRRLLAAARELSTPPPAVLQAAALAGWTDPGTPTGEELDAAIGDLELALSDEHVRAAAAEIGVLVDKGGNPMLHDCDEPQLRRYLAALRARVSA